MLAKEETAQAALGKVRRHKTSLTSFLMSGFELEERQYVEFFFYRCRHNVYCFLDTFYATKSVK